jgi:hypothetical protein
MEQRVERVHLWHRDDMQVKDTGISEAFGVEDSVQAHPFTTAGHEDETHG